MSGESHTKGGHRARRGLARFYRAAWLLAPALLAGCTMQLSFQRRPAADSATAAAPATAPARDQAKAAAQQPEFLPDHLNDPDPIAQQPQTTVAPAMNLFGEVQGAPGVVRTTVAQSRFRQHTSLDDGFDSDVTVDPAGQWIVFASSRNGEHANLYAEKVDGGPITQLTSNPADDAQPVFSPDGKHLAFCSNRGGAWDLYIMDSDGGNVTRLTNGGQDGSQSMHPSYSPDGSRLVYCALGARADGPAEQNGVAEQPVWEIWLMDLATHQRTRLTDGLFPCWSSRRDVDRIVFQRARQRGSRWFSLWTLDITKGTSVSAPAETNIEAKRLTEVAVSSNSALISPAWSPDGKRIVFASITDPTRLQNGKPQGQTDVWILESDLNTRRRLTDGHNTNLTPFWGMDNRVYFISDRGGHENVWSVAAELPAGIGSGIANRPGAVPPDSTPPKKLPPRPDAIDPQQAKVPAASPDDDGPNHPAAIGQNETQEMTH